MEEPYPTITSKKNLPYTWYWDWEEVNEKLKYQLIYFIIYFEILLILCKFVNYLFKKYKFIKILI
jgi:hypothetical protein